MRGMVRGEKAAREDTAARREKAARGIRQTEWRVWLERSRLDGTRRL